jgi:arabinose-5-phosphate isomerase
MNLAPTASTTAALALGDALALAVMKARRFTPEDFALFHPAGALGRRLIFRVGDLMRTGEMVAQVAPDAPLKQALFAITRAQAGAALVVDAESRLLGLVSDGDIRRLLLHDDEALKQPVDAVMNRSPRNMTPDCLVTAALAEMERHPPIAEMPVLDEERRLVGVLNLKDIVKAGIV